MAQNSLWMSTTARQPMYVRGKLQLAEYDSARESTGHRMTAFEVEQAYGPAVFEEIEEHLSAVLLASTRQIESTLRARRETIGLSQAHVASASNLSVETVIAGESTSEDVPVQQLERLAFQLGLDERLIGLEEEAGGDRELGLRLRVLLAAEERESLGITPPVALLFSEAASITRTQKRLQDWLGIEDESDIFEQSGDFGGPQAPAWQIGYQLAETTRKALALNHVPIGSMVELVERRLGIPVVWAELPSWIAGATVASGDHRGVVINTTGPNANVWVRRATLAHEIGHLLFDPDPDLGSVRVDDYELSKRNPETDSGPDFVEQRANAFAIAFLAPPDAVREVLNFDPTTDAVSKVMSHFGIGRTAALYHAANSLWRQYEVPAESEITGSPSAEQIAAEGLTLDFFPLPNTPMQRRGRFAVLVAMSLDAGLISEDTACQYLVCKREELRNALPSLLELDFPA